MTELATGKALSYQASGHGLRVNLPKALRTALAGKEAAVFKVTMAK